MGDYPPFIKESLVAEDELDFWYLLSTINPDLCQQKTSESTPKIESLSGDFVETSTVQEEAKYESKIIKQLYKYSKNVFVLDEEIEIKADIKEYVEKAGFKIYSKQRFLRRAYESIGLNQSKILPELGKEKEDDKEKWSAHIMIINDMVYDHYFKELFCLMKKQIMESLGDKEESFDINILITTIKDFAGKVVGHNKEKINDCISQEKKDHFITAFLLWSIKKPKDFYALPNSSPNLGNGWLEGKALNLLNMDLDDSTLMSIHHIDIDKGKLSLVIESLETMMKEFRN